MISLRRITGIVTLLGNTYLSLSSLYLVVLLAAAAITRRRKTAQAATCQISVLIPAHNEEAGIAETLRGLQSVEYPAGQFTVVVVADNCTDQTASVARSHGAMVYERNDQSQRGKGHALAWAIPRLLADQPETEVVLILDADCMVSPNSLMVVAGHMKAGHRVVQLSYTVSNPTESWSSALRYAAFALINTVRPMGKTALGLSSGLLGSGMALTRDILERHPWSAFSLAEDLEYHLQLVLDGERVVFAPDATVRSAMPTSLRQAQDQQMRWEGGRWHLIRNWSMNVIRTGVERRDKVLIHAGVEPLIPPQAPLLAGNLSLMIMAVMSRHPGRSIHALVNLLLQGTYVVGGLLLVRAPASVYRALAMAPLLVAWKLTLWLKILAGRTPTSWVRTAR